MTMEDTKHWLPLEDLLREGNREALEQFLRELPVGEVAYTISRLDDEDQVRLLSSVAPDFAADLMEHFSDEHAALLLEDLDSDQAAAIVDEMDSDDQADVLAEMGDEDAAAIIEEMDPKEASDVRRRLDYEPDTAGGMMITEYLVQPASRRIREVLADLRDHQEEYENYLVQYVYVVDKAERLQGVVRLQDLVLGHGEKDLAAIMSRSPLAVPVSMGLSELEDTFDHTDLAALPVVDANGRLVGALRRAHVEEAHGERADRSLALFGGIIGGEELRSMPTGERSLRRLAFLVPNIFLGLITAGVIALFERRVLEHVTALVIFLPLVANLSGCSGNQAVAVSIRELSLGVTKPRDIFRVLLKELSVGILNGLAIGLILFWITALWAHHAQWKGPWVISAIVGGVIPFTIAFSAVLGGTVPLLLRRMHIDPAMASGPIITTSVDFVGFLAILGAALVFLHRLV